MPHVSSQISDLESIGPLLDVVISPGKSALGVLGPTTRKAVALIDTGAVCTVVKTGIAAALGLKPIGGVYINTPSSTQHFCYEYAARILFPNQVVVDQVVIEAPLKDQPIDCLIGRDILRHGIFVYVGPQNSFTLSF